MAIDGSNDHLSQYIVAGDLYFLACQDLDDFQQNQLGPVLYGDQSSNLIGGNDLRCFVERATAEVIQDDSLMTSAGFFTRKPLFEHRLDSHQHGVRHTRYPFDGIVCQRIFAVP